MFYPCDDYPTHLLRLTDPSVYIYLLIITPNQLEIRAHHLAEYSTLVERVNRDPPKILFKEVHRFETSWIQP